jgi:hypothetical protein
VRAGEAAGQGYLFAERLTEVAMAALLRAPATAGPAAGTAAHHGAAGLSLVPALA